ncbi:MAG: DUF222 domain-containing protein [Pedococcus sp.]
MFDAFVVAAELQSELARLRADGRNRALGELVDLVGACQSLINQAAAVQTLAMAHVAAIEDVALEDGTVVEQHRGLGHQRLDAPSLVSDQLGVSDAVASSRVGAAVDVVTRVPDLLASMGEGRLDEYRARIVSDELREASAEVCAQVVARIADSLGTEPPAQLRRRVRCALGAVDADLLRTKATRARAERSLCRWPGDEPGVDTWMGSFPAEQSRSGWAVVDGLARQYVRDGKASGLEQARADALMDLIHARATGTFVVQLAVPADRFDAMAHHTAGSAAAPATAVRRPATGTGTATGTEARVRTPETEAVPAGVRSDELVTVAGLGMPGTTQVRRAWLTTLTVAGESDLDATTPVVADARSEVVSCHADTGALLAGRTDHLGEPGRLGPSRLSSRSGRGRATESEAYRPPPALVDLVKARDGRCRFPGCTINARFCDLDHVTPWPLGPTHPANLICLCRRHHRIKQMLRWRVRIDADASVTWTDPTGRLRTTMPVDFLQLDTDLGAPLAAPPKPCGSAPRDTPEVRWSAWEEELAHELSRAERHGATRKADPRRTGEPPARCGLDVESGAGLDAFVLDPALAALCPHRGPHGGTRTEDGPPF